MFNSVLGARKKIKKKTKLKRMIVKLVQRASVRTQLHRRRNQHDATSQLLGS
jgi:hypothetical protein